MVEQPGLAGRSSYSFGRHRPVKVELPPVRNRLETLSTGYQSRPQVVAYGDGWVVRTADGRKIATASQEADARFIADAPTWVKDLVAEVAYLRDELHTARSVANSRVVSDTLRRVRDELEAAESYGLHTKDGQRRARAALAEVRDRT